MTYDKDYASDVLPAVKTGDTVVVKYESHRTDRTQRRSGEVVQIHANGFTIDHAPDKHLFTSVRAHYRENMPSVVRVSTVSETDGDHYAHSARLNRRHDSPDQVKFRIHN